jgi:nitrogen-specific signal transduction histidine kinase/CheY-like chemotaxis protein
MPGDRLGVAFEDVSERKRIQDERIELERQIQHGQKLESLGLLAGGIAHDFNNILTIILGNASLGLNNLSEDQPTHKCLTEVKVAAQRAAELTRQMLDYSGRGSFEMRNLDVSFLVKGMATLLRSSIPNNATLELDCSLLSTPIKADVNQIQQIVLNLITNAAESYDKEEGGVVRVQTGVIRCEQADLDKSCILEKPPAGKYVHITVSDTGSGMTEATRAKLFEPFFTTKFYGRGLGMAATLGIVKSHNGAILIESESGVGTTVRTLFPVQDSPGLDIITADSPLASVDDSPVKGTVLIVDDEEAVLDIAERTIQRIGFTVLIASSGLKALDIFKTQGNSIDCVLLDMTMPQMDGIKTYKELRKINQQVAVFLASGYAEKDIEDKLKDLDIAGFIQKPYEASTLKQTLLEFLRARSSTPLISKEPSY